MNKRFTNIIIIIVCVVAVFAITILKHTEKKEAKETTSEATTQESTEVSFESQLEDQMEKQDTSMYDEQAVDGYVPEISIEDSDHILRELPRWVKVSLPKELEAFLSKNAFHTDGMTVTIVGNTLQADENQASFFCSIEETEKIQVQIELVNQKIGFEIYNKEESI